MNFMENFEKQDGVAFLIIYYSARNELYYMRFSEIKRFWERAKTGGRKSIRYEELSPAFFIPLKNGCFVSYLEALQQDLDLRD